MRGESVVWFELPREEAIALDVFDLRGARVRELAKGRFGAGMHRVQWAGEGEAGRLPSGIYFIRLRAGTAEAIQRVTVLQ
jgi:hypothetical protein